MESLRFLPQVWNNWGSKSETLTKGKMWRHGQGRAPQLTQGQRWSSAPGGYGGFWAPSGAECRPDQLWQFRFPTALKFFVAAVVAPLPRGCLQAPHARGRAPHNPQQRQTFRVSPVPSSLQKALLKTLWWRQITRPPPAGEIASPRHVWAHSPGGKSAALLLKDTARTSPSEAHAGSYSALGETDI